MSEQKATKDCPFCGEEILAVAIKCKHCGSTITQQQVSSGDVALPVSFGDAISICFRKYADFEGRASRSEFWFFFLFEILAGISFAILEAIGMPEFFGWMFTLATLLPSLAVGARRLHDVNMSGWWQLLMLTLIGIIPLIIWFATAGKPPNKK